MGVSLRWPRGSPWRPRFSVGTCLGRRHSLQLAGGCADMWGRFLGPDSLRVLGEGGTSRAARTPRGAAESQAGGCGLRASVRSRCGTAGADAGPAVPGRPEHGKGPPPRFSGVPLPHLLAAPLLHTCPTREARLQPLGLWAPRLRHLGLNQPQSQL